MGQMLLPIHGISRPDPANHGAGSGLENIQMRLCQNIRLYDLLDEPILGIHFATPSDKHVLCLLWIVSHSDSGLVSQMVSTTPKPLPEKGNCIYIYIHNNIYRYPSVLVGM